MFSIWDSAGIRTPYYPGVIRERRVEKVQKTLPARKAGQQPVTYPTESPGSEINLGTKAYRQLGHPSRPREPAVLAKQLMSSPVTTLPPTTPISAAWELIHNRRFRHIPILSEQDKLIGILSDRDLFRETISRLTASNQPISRASGTTIQEVMITNILAASPETEIRAIARLLFEERIGAMPIVNDVEELVGILTRSDILRTVVTQAPFELWI